MKCVRFLLTLLFAVFLVPLKCDVSNLMDNDVLLQTSPLLDLCQNEPNYLAEQALPKENLSPPIVSPVPPAVSAPQQNDGLKDMEAYIQISSIQTQIPTPVIGSLIKADTIELAKNFELTPMKDAVVCKVSGIYLLCSGSQAASLSLGVSGYLDIWFELNGKPVLASNSRQYVNENSQVALMSNTFLIELKAGDTLSNRMSASGPHIGIAAIPAGVNNESTVASFEFSVIKIF